MIEVKAFWKGDVDAFTLNLSYLVSRRHNNKLDFIQLILAK
jgi:hypothetical protein